MPGLLICLPFGLVGLWRRPGLSLWLRVGVTLATVALFVGVGLTDDGTSPPKEEAAPTADANASGLAPSPTDEAQPEVTEPPVSVMPKIAGLPRSQAEKALAEAGLVVSKVRQVPSARPRGTVLRQGKKVGASLPAGSAVVLVVAAPYPRVPSVVGRSKSDASSRLRSAGFQVKVTVETRTSGKNGVVLRQNPVGTDRAKPQSTVTIVVSSIIRPLAPPAQNCTSGYRPCLTPASD
ncbi:PASTA domain-containing protein [Nocardioides speluncae]|uniref:PASTA domain-containing protein n=1 Tax=Nocardioides speluncae TaxID=2670337 RepID=UPI001F0BA936|nr:PASTA domain-containing protein [Nocardioides speluncae]